MSFFKAPAWAKPQANDDDGTEKDLFSHSASFMAIQREMMVQEKRRAELLKRKEVKDAQRKQEKAGTKKEKAETAHKSEQKCEGLDADEQGRLKKRRINSAEAAKLLALAGVKPITIDDDEDDDQESERPAVRGSPRRYLGTSPEDCGLLRSKSAVGSLEDVDDENEDEIRITAVGTKSPSPEPEEVYDSDPDIAAIERSAREKHRLKVLQEKKPTAPGAANLDGDVAGPSRIGLAARPPPDPTISLFISSDIPGTEPLIIYRKLSQSLEAVHQAWCQKQKFSKEQSEKIIFTWCGRRLYGVTTCQRLGIEFDAQGNVTRVNGQDSDGAERVHIIAMTEEMFAQQKAAKERQARTESGQYGGEPGPEVETEPAAEEAEKQEMIRLVIKAKDKKDFKVRVTEKTLFKKVIGAAKRSFNLSSDQPAYLQFDGERLNPEDPVSSTDIEDMDSLDLLLGE